RIHVQVQDLGEAQVGVEWDVRACGSFELDQGRWQRLCPGAALPR
ncbi:MAG: Ycf34 family protein, partial [Vulcanococcus sp.]